jgi:uroporphyrinogen decarboxylase
MIPRILEILSGASVEHTVPAPVSAATPIWCMRQAGRYLPEYRALRERAGSFLALCNTPELAAEATLQPIQRFGFDAAIIFSDILLLPHAMGLGLEMAPDEGPYFQHPITSIAGIQQLPMLEIETALSAVMTAIRYTKQALPAGVPLIGFTGSPWTLAAYMLEGRHIKHFERARRWVYQEPAALQQLLTYLSQQVAAYLLAQARAGADILMIFDTWSGLLPYGIYRQIMWPHLVFLSQALQAAGKPCIYFAKDGGRSLVDVAGLAFSGLGLDYHVDLNVALPALQHTRVAVQGNLDPAALYASDSALKAAVTQIMTTVAEHQWQQRFIFNLGHGIPKDVAPEKLAYVVELVKTWR